MHEAPFFSVILNAFNAERFLGETVRSVLNQSFENWECILWDNQSTDQTATIFQSFSDKRLRYILAPSHTPLSRARNLAVAKATGKWIAFLDCDDLWDCDKLQKQFDIINEEDSSLGLVYSRARWLHLNTPGTEVIERFKGHPLPEGDILDALLLFPQNFVPCASMAVRKDVYLELGGIPENYHQAEDYYLVAEIAASYKVRAVQTACCWIRSHGGNLTLKQRYLNYWEGLRIVEKWRSHLRRSPNIEQYDFNVRFLGTMAALYCLKEQRRPLYALYMFVRKGSPTIACQEIWGFLKRKTSRLTLARAQAH